MKAEVKIVGYVQSKVFRSEIKQIQTVGPRMKRTQLYNLRPFLDESSCLRVGGRLQAASIPYTEKHQLILPKSHHLTRIIARHFHRINQHAPPKTLLCLMRKRYWVINGMRLMYQIEQKCITCRKVLALPKEQIQGNLPAGRVAVGNVWDESGCDIMGPVLVRIRRSDVKRYILGLVSFTVKAVHFEVIPDMTVESFLNAMRRFVSRRSRPKKLMTDCAGTFEAGVRELNELQKLFNESGVEHFMREQEIEWIANVPKASNRNGLFERPFRALRRALLTVLNGQTMMEDQLSTIVAECEHLYNSRPLCSSSASADDLEAITPNDIINPEPAKAYAPGVFDPRDLILRNKYRQVQAVVNAFWKRFRNEYLTSLQERTKSITRVRDYRVGDLVMLYDELKIAHRGHFPLGLVTAVKQSLSDNAVRTVSVKTQSGVFERPVNKICLLEGVEEL